MKCPQDYSRYDDLKDECLDCPQIEECKEGKIQFQSKELVKKIHYAIIEEWYPYFIDELLSLKSEYFMREAELRLMFYFELGRRIATEVLDNKERAKYGDSILHESANCLNISERNIYYAIKFYRTYPNKIDDCPATNWTAVKKLLDNKGDLKVLSECLHRHTEIRPRKYCLDCHKQVK